ncbi:prostate stem cell antigen-like [Ruditapes philippinarum]|uniref:prostate stem cell antigen-like n=1 Tax=Ruditapes philippinarum TaxID=129788 RepID=UPI00295B9CA9|nr:prostate stem cell antigen-like [Ruditapes philippinarum]
MMLYLLSVALVLQLSINGTAALQCYNCSNISDAGDCLTVTDCRAGQSCYMHKVSSGKIVTLGCTDNQQCGVTPGLVGRGVDKRQQSQCHECCSTDKCNKNLCSHLTLQIHFTGDAHDLPPGKISH